MHSKEIYVGSSNVNINFRHQQHKKLSNLSTYLENEENYEGPIVIDTIKVSLKKNKEEDIRKKEIETLKKYIEENPENENFQIIE